MTNATRIAKIKRAILGYESHGILTVHLDLDFGGSGIIAGGYALDEPHFDDEDNFIGRYGSAFGMEFVARTMKACGAENWDQVQGTTVLAILDTPTDEWGARVIGIKPLPTEKGKEFRFDTLAEELIDLGVERAR